MDKKALAALILKEETSLYRAAKSILHNEADCCDAVQEAIAIAFEKISSLKYDRFAKTWLIRITINECKAILRQQQRMVEMDDTTISEGGNVEDYSDLYEAIRLLQPDYRAAVVLYYIEGFSIREVSQILDVPEGTVKSRLKRSRQQLEKILNKEDIYSEKKRMGKEIPGAFKNVSSNSCFRS